MYQALLRISPLLFELLRTDRLHYDCASTQLLGNGAGVRLAQQLRQRTFSLAAVPERSALDDCATRYAPGRYASKAWQQTA